VKKWRLNMGGIAAEEIENTKLGGIENIRLLSA
jgi:hypothetical protein